MVNDMNYKSTIKKHSVIISICVICSVLLIAGTSYALFFQVDSNTENQVVKTGKLEVSYGNQSSKITVNPISPIEDETALADPNYSSTIRINNTGSLPASYTLKISKDTEAMENDGRSVSELVDLQYIKVALYDGETEIVGPTTLENGNLTKDDEGRYILSTGSLAAQNEQGDNINLKVVVWLAKNTPADENNKYVYLKLDVISEVDAANTPEGQVNTEG